MIDPPLRIGYIDADFAALPFSGHWADNQRGKAAGADSSCPCDLTLAACKHWQFEMGNGCAVTSCNLRLLGLIGCDEAIPILGRLQPARLALLLTGEAEDAVDLVMTTGMLNYLSHPLTLLGGDFEAVGMSQVESSVR